VKVVILAAGQGKRLLPLTEDIPKCLLDIGGRRLLERQIDAFVACGVDEIVVITGYGAAQVDDVLEQMRGHLSGVELKTTFNPFFGVADNLASCWMARHDMDQDFILVNGDNLFQADMVEQLLKAKDAPITVAIAHSQEYDNDDMKVMLDGERLTEIGKTLPIDTVDAESIGMLLFRSDGPAHYRAALEEAMMEPTGLRQWYLSVINALAKQITVMTQPVDGIEWCEVDFPADLQQARQLVAGWKK
jgi:choline kinase